MNYRICRKSGIILKKKIYMYITSLNDKLPRRSFLLKIRRRFLPCAKQYRISIILAHSLTLILRTYV